MQLGIENGVSENVLRDSCDVEQLRQEIMILNSKLEESTYSVSLLMDKVIEHNIHYSYYQLLCYALTSIRWYLRL